VADVCLELEVAEQTYYWRRNQGGGMKANDVKRLKEIERRNATLKRLLAEAELEKAVLKELAEGNFSAQADDVPRLLTYLDRLRSVRGCHAL